MSEVLETKHPQPPIVVCFFSPRSSRTLNYLNGFHRSYDTFTRMRLSLRFGILNIVDYPQGKECFSFKWPIMKQSLKWM